MVRFIHTADWQLGFHRTFLDDDAQARFTQARIDAISTIGQIAAAEGARFVVVAGDVFESNQMDRRTVHRALETIAAIDLPVLLLPGNHDPLDASSIYTSSSFHARCPDNVVVLDDHEPRTVVDDVEVVGVPWTSNELLHDAVAERLDGLSPAAPGVTRIMVAHGVVDALQMDRRDPGVIGMAGVQAALDDGRIHYLALGDRHSTTPIGTSGRVWYAGAPEPTRFREVNAGKVLCVDATPARCRTEQHHTGHWRFVQRYIELTSEADVHQLTALLDNLDDQARTIVRVKLAGVVPLGAMAQLEYALDTRAAGLACLDVVGLGTDLVAVADDEDLASMEVGPVTRAVIEDLSARATSAGADGESATRALGLLYRLALREEHDRRVA